MRRTLRIFAIAALVLAATSGTATGAPQSDKQRAAQSFQIGKAAFARGDFEKAAAAFEQAAFFSPHPATLLNAAESWELAQNPARAAQLYDRVLEAPVLEAQHQQVAQKQLAKLEKKVGTIAIKAPSKARIDVDDREETATKVRVAPGPHRFKVTYADGETRTEVVDVAAGETREVDFLTRPENETTKPAEPERPPPPPPPSRGGPPVGTWISFGAAAAAGGAATYFGLQTLDAAKAYDARPSVATRDDFNAQRLYTNVAIGVAVAAVAIGVVLWLVSSPEPQSASAGTILSWQ
ncbi:MAG: hypothetical protein KIT84_29185 [Labilithrix sp.]|nr:hypothetical protein [Labilithrix sp.]MCW5815136.1 hypothetical protein [Labilithrix sp.]